LKIYMSVGVTTHQKQTKKYCGMT